MKNRVMNAWQRLTYGASHIVSYPIAIFILVVWVFWSLRPNGLICWRCGGLRAGGSHATISRNTPRHSGSDPADKTPEQSSPEPLPLTRNTDGAPDQQGEGQPSLDRRRDDEDEDASSAGAATQSLGKRNTKTSGASATLTRQKPAAPPPRPPDGAPAAVWDHYLRALPPTHRNRRAARSQVQPGVLERPRAERIAALHDFAHSDQEREFLDYTGYLPSLDDEMDHRILGQERQRQPGSRPGRGHRESTETNRESTGSNGSSSTRLFHRPKSGWTVCRTTPHPRASESSSTRP